MKVKPMINGIEVKVGQIWEDHYGNRVRIKAVNDNGVILDDRMVYYSTTGKPIGPWSTAYSLMYLHSDVETTYGETPRLSDSCLTSIRKATVEPKYTFTESEINAKINQVIKEFDWNKAASVYTALNWTWFTTQIIPTIGDLVATGIKHMKEAVEIAVSNQEEGYVSCGGLIGRAYITDGKLTVSLEMQVTEAISY